ncbi:MAG: HD domain-containing protein [Caldilineaceae bacterium]
MQPHTFTHLHTASWRAFQDVLAAFAAQSTPLYIVGGAVRDLWLSELRGQPLPLADLDLLTPANALQTARRVADALGWAYYPLDAERDVARLVKNVGERQLICDVTTPRGGSVESDLRLRDFTINAMALRMDELSATNGEIGALRGHLIDPWGGQKDLAARVIRAVTDQSLPDDPVRLVRGVRLAAQFDFAIATETQQQIVQLAHLIAQCSAERVRDELWKALATAAPADAICLLDQVGLLPHLLPEVVATQGVRQSAAPFLDVYEHTLLTVRHAARLRKWLLASAQAADADDEGANTPVQSAWRAALTPWRAQLTAHFGQQMAAGHTRAQWLVWHALLHDVGKPATRSEEFDAAGQVRVRFFEHENVGAQLVAKRLGALRFSRDEVMLGTTAVQAHMHPHWLRASFAGQPLSRRAMFRFFRKTGGLRSDALPGIDVLLLALADYMAIHKGLNQPQDDSALSQWRQYLEHIVQCLAFAFADDGPQHAQQQPLANGHLLMRELGLPPGPQLGRLMEQLAEAQAAGEITTPTEAIAWAAQLLRLPK